MSLAVVDGVSVDVLDLIIGPAGALVLLSIGLWFLWRAHERSDRRNEDLIDKQQLVISEFPAALREQTAVIKDLTRDRPNEDDEWRSRRDRRASDR